MCTVENWVGQTQSISRIWHLLNVRHCAWTINVIIGKHNIMAYILICGFLDSQLVNLLPRKSQYVNDFY